MHFTYFKKQSKLNLRKVLLDIKTTGLNNFTLGLIHIPEHLRELRLLLALEQYYLLKDPQNNSLLVAAGSPGGQRVAEANRERNRQAVYMYLGDTLIYVFSSVSQGPNSLCTLLSTSRNTVANCFKNNTLFLGTFTLSKKPIENTNADLMSLQQVQETVLAVRGDYVQVRTKNLTRGVTPPITLIRVVDGMEFHFDNYTLAGK
jgi:hypothetical protein